MSKSWILAKRPAFARDVLRDFCLVARVLAREFAFVDEGGGPSFSAIRDLLGQESNKGLLWRLKDTSHHLFRGHGASVVGRQLDWCIGYVFHETLKLKEDAYQQSTYGQAHRELLAEVDGDKDPDLAAAMSDLGTVLKQTSESIQREVTRLRFILTKCRHLLPMYLASQQGNVLLARLLFEEQTMVRNVFGDDYPRLIHTIYGDQPELLYIYAARSLRQGGWMLEAATAANKAVEINPESPLALQEKDIIDNWRRKLAG